MIKTLSFINPKLEGGSRMHHVFIVSVAVIIGTTDSREISA